MKRVIYLIGDALVDNFYWLTLRDRDLSAELTDLGYQVHNYGVEGVKVSNIFLGCPVEEKYHKARTYPYPIDHDGRLRPINLLSRISHNNGHFQSTYRDHFVSMLDQPQQAMVVLSVGGTDIKDNSVNICLGKEYFINTILTPSFVAQYDRAIQACLKSCPKIVLLSVYLPYLGPGARYGMFSGLARSIIEPWSTFVRQKGKQHNIAVLDLSNVLDCQDRSHYAEDETKASNVSSRMIARCLDDIYRNYHGGRVYSLSNNVIKME